MRTLLQILGIRCSHVNTTWPRTRRTKNSTETYVRCTACGTKIVYDINAWKRVKVCKG